MPFALMIAAAFGGSQQGLLAASVVVPYLLTIYAQIKHEVLFVKRGGPAAFPKNTCSTDLCQLDNAQLWLVSRHQQNRRCTEYLLFSS